MSMNFIRVISIGWVSSKLILKSLGIDLGLKWVEFGRTWSDLEITGTDLRQKTRRSSLEHTCKAGLARAATTDSWSPNSANARLAVGHPTRPTHISLTRPNSEIYIHAYIHI